MHLPLLTVLAALAQDPAAQAPAPPAPGTSVPTSTDARRADCIELRGGEVLEGRIVLERGTYLEIELAPGAVVGLRTTEIAAVRRGGGSTLPAAPAGGLEPMDEWFVLHDGEGKAVGWLHAATTTTVEGLSRVQEEWEFAQGTRHFQVTMLELLDPQRGPVSCYFRERISEEVLGSSPDERLAARTRVLEERIVEARVDGALLEVERFTNAGRTKRQLPWPQDGTFPLLARALSLRGEPVGTVTVFDPGREELRARTWLAARTRTVPGDGGKPLRVREVTETGPAGDNAVWVDASSRTVRREIAGPSLVALRCGPELARNAVGSPRDFGAAFVADADGRFGLWRPNPAWDVDSIESGGIVLRCGLLDATVSCSLLEHLDAGTAPSAAAEAVERWYRLLQPGMKVVQRSRRQIAGRSAVGLDLRGRIGDAEQRVALHVVPLDASFLVVRCTARKESWAELEADFDGVLRHLELEAPAIAALQQGRSAEPKRRAAAPPPAGTPAPGASASPAGANQPAAPTRSAPGPRPAPGREGAPPRIRVPAEEIGAAQPPRGN